MWQQLVHIKYRNARCTDPPIKRCHLIGVATKERVNMLKKLIADSNKIEKFQEATTAKYFLYDVRVANNTTQA